MDIDVSDLNKLAVDLGKAGAKAVKPAAAAIAKTAHSIEADAKVFAPVDTGNLRSSISTTTRGLHAEIGPTADYAAYVEEGTSTNAPQAFMGPAYDRNAGTLVTALELVVGTVL